MTNNIGRMVEYPGGGSSRAYFSKPVGDKRTHGIIIVPEIWGINDYIKETADSLAKQGFASVVPDIYASGVFGGVLTEKDMKAMLDFSSMLNWEMMMEKSYLEKELAKLSVEMSGSVRKVIKVFQDGVAGHEVFLELQRAAGYFDSGGYAIVREIKYRTVSSSGNYPPVLAQEYLEYLKLFHKTFYDSVTLETILRKRNPVKPELYELLKRGEEKLYCIMPFIRMDLAPMGLRCCCWLTDLADINSVPLGEGEDLLKAWKGDTFERVRESIRDGSYRHCQLYACSEVRGERKSLLTLGELRAEYPSIAAYIEGRDKRYSGMPEYCSLSLDTVCNLSCPSCSRFVLPNIPGRIKSEVINGLKAVGKNLNFIFIAGMGEVFFSPVYLDWIKNFKKKDFPDLRSIFITTNGLKLTSEIWNKLPDEFKAFVSQITISIDGATESTYEENRRGGDFKALLNNLAFARNLKENGKIKKLWAHFVYQANNYFEMPEIIDLARRYSFDEVCFERLMNWGSYKAEEYRRRDVGDPGHPEHASLTAVLDSISEYNKTNPIPRIVFMK